MLFFNWNVNVVFVCSMFNKDNYLRIVKLQKFYLELLLFFPFSLLFTIILSNATWHLLIPSRIIALCIVWPLQDITGFPVHFYSLFLNSFCIFEIPFASDYFRSPTVQLILNFNVYSILFRNACVKLEWDTPY